MQCQNENCHSLATTVIQDDTDGFFSLCDKHRTPTEIDKNRGYHMKTAKVSQHTPEVYCQRCGSKCFWLGYTKKSKWYRCYKNLHDTIGNIAITSSVYDTAERDRLKEINKELLSALNKVKDILGDDEDLGGNSDVIARMLEIIYIAKNKAYAIRSRAEAEGGSK